MADRSLSLVLVKVDDKEAYNRVAEQITTSPYYHNPQVKCETESSGIGSFLDAYRDLLWGMRWLLAPACLGTLALVLANAISISVRERRTEMAVLKVLGFRPAPDRPAGDGRSGVAGTARGLCQRGPDLHDHQLVLARDELSHGIFSGLPDSHQRLVVGRRGGHGGRFGRQSGCPPGRPAA